MLERNSIKEYKKTRAIAEDVKKQRVHTETLDYKYNMEHSSLKRKDQFYKKGTRDIAFSSSQTKIMASSKMAAHVYEDMVLLAQKKQWDMIKVSGAKEFKRNVWLEASSQGMSVNGYKPTEQDLRMLAKRTQQSSTKNSSQSESKTDQQIKPDNTSAANEPIEKKQKHTHLDLNTIKKMAQEYAKTITHHENSQKILEENVMQRIHEAIEKGVTPMLKPVAHTARVSQPVQVAQPEKSRQVELER